MKQDVTLQKLNSNIEQLLKQDENPLSFTEACKYLDVSKSALYKMTCKNLITHFKPNGKKIYFRKSDLSKWLFRVQKRAVDQIEQDALNYVTIGGAK